MCKTITHGMYAVLLRNFPVLFGLQKCIHKYVSVGLCVFIIHLKSVGLCYQAGGKLSPRAEDAVTPRGSHKPIPGIKDLKY